MIMSKHEKVLSIYQLGYLVCTVIACASLAILLGWKFIVYGILIASVIALSTKILLLKIYFEGILSEFMRAMGKNLVILSLFSFAIFIVKYFCSDIMASWKLIVEILILGFFYLAVLFIFKHELLNRVISILKGK
jgi:hypothetical protein